MNSKWKQRQLYYHVLGEINFLFANCKKRKRKETSFEASKSICMKIGQTLEDKTFISYKLKNTFSYLFKVGSHFKKLRIFASGLELKLQNIFPQDILLRN